MGCAWFGALIGLIVCWGQLANRVRAGELDGVPLIFMRNPFHPLVPLAIGYQLVRGGVPGLREMYWWSFIIWGAAA
jgi:hypothetical protein